MDARASLVVQPRADAKRCTDFLCCLIFCGAIAGLGVLGMLGFTSGNPEVLQNFIRGTDDLGRECGVSDGVQDFPLAYFTLEAGHSPIANNEWDISDRLDLKVVCTNKCPQGAANATLESSVMRTDSDLCPPDMYPPTRSLCSWYGGSTVRIAFYCVDPDVFVNIGFSWEQWAEDVHQSWVLLAFTPLIALCFGFAFLYVVYKCGTLIIWGAVAVGVLLPLVAGIALFSHAGSMSEEGHGEDHLDDFPPETQRNIAYVLWVVCGLMCILACFFAHTVNGIVAVLRATADFLQDVPSQMLQPLVVGFSQFVLFAVLLVVFVLVASIGAAEGDRQECLGFGDLYCIKWDGTAQFFGLLYIFIMLYWLMNFLIAVSHFGTAHTVMEWYFAPPDEHGRKYPRGRNTLCDFRLSFAGLCTGLANHPGSLAFGSFVVAICNISRIVLCWVEKSDATPSNPVSACCRTCLNCMADCFLRFVEFISVHAYVELALTGNGFCASAQRALQMSVAHPGLMTLVGRVALVMRLLGMALVCAGTCSVYVLLTWAFPIAGLQNPEVPLVAAGFVSLVIGELVMHPLSSAARATLHCYILDEEQSHAMGMNGAQHPPPALKAFVDTTAPRTNRAGAAGFTELQ